MYFMYGVNLFKYTETSFYIKHLITFFKSLNNENCLFYVLLNLTFLVFLIP